MTEQLDSRALRYTDTYGQRFMKPGTYPYSLAAAGVPWRQGKAGFAVEVTDERGDGTMRQHLVTVSWRDGRFLPDPATVRVGAGDLVMWHCPGAVDRAFAVHGEKDFFASDRLVNECGYSHVFATPGEHVWTDAYGSGIRGVVRVKAPDVASARAHTAWQRSLGSGTLVMITDRGVEPAEVDVVVGQTVFFALVTGKGLTITDETLLGKGRITEPAERTAAVAHAASFRRA